MDDDILAKLQADIGIILLTTQHIKEDVVEIKSITKGHNTRIRALEIGQGELRVEMRAEVRTKGIIAVVIASVVAFISDLIKH